MYDHLMHAEASKGLVLLWMHSVQLGWSLFQFSYISVYWWVSCGYFSIKLHKQDPFLAQNKYTKTLSAESYFLNFLLYIDGTELPLQTRFRVRMVSLCIITCDNGDSHFQLQTALWISIHNLATHYTSFLENPSSWMIAYYYELSILIASHNFHVVMKWFFKGGVEGLLLQETC